MTDKIKLKLLQVTVDGEKSYLRGTSIFHQPSPVTKDPLEAINYLEMAPTWTRRFGQARAYSHDIDKDIRDLNIAGATVCAKSGLWGDCPPEIIDLEIEASQLDVDIAKLPPKPPIGPRLLHFNLRLLSVISDVQLAEYYVWMREQLAQDDSSRVRWERDFVVEEMSLRFKKI